MKKEYTAPEAEKLEFKYTETVVASGETSGDAKAGDDGTGVCYYSPEWGCQGACSQGQ